MNQDDVDFAWLVGLLEGEGCFTYESNGQKYRHPRITLGMTDMDVVLRASKLMPGSVVATSHPPSRIKRDWQPLHTARCNGASALDLMRRVLPHMGDRRSRRIQEILEAYARDRPDWGQCTSPSKRHPRCLSRAVDSSGKCVNHLTR